MDSATVRRQELPPPGGYKPLNYARVPAKSLIGGKGLIALNLAVTAGALYLYSLNYKRVRIQRIENRSSALALMPMLTAERDRAYLKQLIKNRQEEAELMKNVDGWVVGTYMGEPIYKTLPPDTLIKPKSYEYFAHTSDKAFNDYADLMLWQ